MRILIETIPHTEQRYETVGDWQVNGDDITIRVSDLGDWRFNAAVAVHELVEALLCRAAGVAQAAVDAFDQAYETARKDGDISEPGDALDAPYRDQHGFATAVERMLIAAMGLSWEEYTQAIEAL